MWSDPIVEETRKIRDELAARLDYDVQELGQYYLSQQEAADRKIVKRPAKKIKQEKERVA